MPLTLHLKPNPLLAGLHNEPQLCYALIAISATGDTGTRPVNWALVADASRSMRIPIVDERQFRDLIRTGGAQETLVDGVPVWQLSGPVPASVRDTAPDALDHVVRALHTIVDRLDERDYFALVACAASAQLLAHGSGQSDRAALVRGIERLKPLDLGNETDLSLGLEVGLKALRESRDGVRAERLLLLTDGFTLNPDACLALASTAGAERITISTIGLGGEFQEAVLTEIADRSGGRALFLHRPTDIPHTIAAELEAARMVAARALTLTLQLEPQVALRRVTRIRPSLTVLYEQHHPGEPAPAIPIGDLEAHAPAALLLELLVPPHTPGTAFIGHMSVSSSGGSVVDQALSVFYQSVMPAQAPEVIDAAARASVARLQRRALAAAASGNAHEAARLLRASAERLDELGEPALASTARTQAHAFDTAGRADRLATKELTYATRRLGEG